MRAPVLILVALAAACGDGGQTAFDAPPAADAGCTGAGDAAVTGATLTVGEETFGYGEFDWGANNDCGQTSITIQGRQVSPPSDFGIGLCVPRPDQLGAAPVSLADPELVELRGAAAQAGGCTYQFVPTATPEGSVTFGGLCTAAGASFTVTFAGSVAGTRSCDGGAAEDVTLELGGTALVHARP